MTRMRPLILLALGLGLTVGWGQPGQAQLPPPVSQGYSLLERGWVNDAIAAFTSALGRYPNSPEARLGLAIAYQRAGRDAEAWQAYQAVLQVSPDHPRALKALGELGGYRPEWNATGIAALTRLLAQNPDNQEARSQRALLYGYQGQFSESLADYDRLLAASPSPATRLGAAQVYAFSGDFEGALALFDRYRQTGPFPVEALPTYALALQETGNPKAAIALLEPELREASRTDLLSLQIRAGLANAYDASGQTQKALELLLPLEGKAEAQLPLARAYSAIGRRQLDPSLFEQATVLYQQALASTPNPSYGLRVEVADVLSEWPDSQTLALEMFQQLATENPDIVSLPVRAALLAYSLNSENASAVAAQLQDLLPPVPAAKPEQRAIATALVRLDNPASALLPTYETVVAAIDVPLLHYRIAQIHLNDGNLPAAKAALSTYRATATGQADWGAELLIADLERQLGELPASAERYEALIAQRPNPLVTVAALRGLAFVRTLQGQPEAALPIYAAVLVAAPDNLDYQLSYALLAYRTEQISADEAGKTLAAWVTANGLMNPSADVFDLAGALPAEASRADLYPTLLTLRPGDIWLQWRTIQLLAQVDPTQAQTQMAELVAAYPDDVTVYFFQGELAQQQGDLPLAAAAYETILAQQPDHLGALSALAGVRFQQGDLVAARDLYGQVLALDPDHWEAQYAIAELNVAVDQRLTALDQFRQLPPASPDSANPVNLEQRRQEIEFDLLRRRGFQPAWERY
ncbi:MAG: tetratricopeptide repeat protein [Nodosilinea sp.]